MNLRSVLEAGHSTAITRKIAAYVGADQRRFDALMEVFLTGDYTMSQRAAWPLGDAGVAHPHLAIKHLGSLLKKLGDKKSHPAVARGITRILQFMDIPEKYSVHALDLCYGFITNEATPPAIRANSISTVAKICERYPGLRPEFELVLKELMALPQPPAVAVRVRKALSAQARMPGSACYGGRN